MAGEILHVGDSVVVTDRGRVTVERIDVCLRPSIDPAAEEYSANVDAIELGEHGPPFVIGFAGHWAYGIHVAVGTVEPADRLDDAEGQGRR